MIRNNSTLVFLIYTYHDKRGKLKETAVLSTNMNAREEVNIFYNEDDSVVLEYLPGSPWMKSYNEIVR
ncbi:hypothetical protein [Paenibacillus albus]|uniref:Uncharacterized protein n=1 Tax=Paenibacillus albus TaxID=2495582 RepID=A0A3S9AA35_9BACL|nr:hypothetical protein [Paenibacillus albus]AZN42618.1 hypothetical protein EJC50_25200 [Paenibacillus albus]